MGRRSMWLHFLGTVPALAWGLSQVGVRAQGLGVLSTNLHAFYRAAYEDARSAKFVRIPLEDLSTEGGEAVGYFREDGLLGLMEIQLYGEMARSEYSVVWHDRGSFLATERHVLYNRPFYWTEEMARGQADDEVFDLERSRVIERSVLVDEGLLTFTEGHLIEPVDAFTEIPVLVAMADSVYDLLMFQYEMGRSVGEVGSIDPVTLMSITAPIHVDTALIGVALVDEVSAGRVLGTEKDRTLVETERHPFPHASYALSSEDAYVTFSLHYGAGRDQYAEMELSRFRPDSLLGSLSVQGARSSLGVELGMSESELIDLIGPASFIGRSASGHRVLSYRLGAIPSSSLLYGYGLPSYYITAEFDMTGLVEYRFGFEYP